MTPKYLDISVPQYYNTDINRKEYKHGEEN